MYAVLGSRPDITYCSVTALSRYNIKPLKMHITAAKRVLCYLKTTSELRIHYQWAHLSPRDRITVIGNTDLDWVGNLTTRKSVSCCLFGLGTPGGEETVMYGLIYL
jgi:hypothetical protein